ncbi:MAG TPA: DUF465 domain-containing protein [Gammaproteobacteria bacterium]|nr:DUF465 domain-containing protein [Gammaproteobacteria bacterium]
MYGVRHDIARDFPEHQSRIEQLKTRDPAFARLLAEYDETDKRIYGLEQQRMPVTDSYFSGLKRHRAHLKDRLYAHLQLATA